MNYITNILRDFRSVFQRMDSKILLRQVTGTPGDKWIERCRTAHQQLTNSPLNEDNMIAAYQLGMTAVDVAIMLALLEKVNI